MRFLVDAQLPPALARWLASGGYVAEHVGDRGMQAASDQVIWDYALQVSAAIITKDDDFCKLTMISANSSCSVRQDPR